MHELPLLGGSPATGLDLLAAEFAATVADGAVWLAIGQGLVFGCICLAFGIWVARTVGLLGSDAPAGETLGVGLASGLMVLAAWWAAIWSGGRSSFTPVAVGFAIAIVLAVVRRVRRRDLRDDRTSASGDVPRDAPARWFPRRSLMLTVLASGVFVVAVGVLYGSTMAPSPRDGVQPVEFSDAAFYSIIGRDIAATGTETNLSPSGFSNLANSPTQTWYHWAEIWLASAVITVLGAAPIAARYFIVLPIVLLAAAALTGSFVRRVNGTRSRWAFVFGFLGCLFLAPVPLAGTFFSSWAAGIIFGINSYGLAAAAVLVVMNCLGLLGRKKPTRALAIYIASAVAFILPAHVVIAVLAIVGLGSVVAIGVGQSIKATRRLPFVGPVWQEILVASGILLAATAAWSLLTGHGLSSSASSPNVSAFNPNWQFSVAFAYLGAGVLLAIPVAALLFRRQAPLLARMCIGTIALIVFGAIAWGARLDDFNMYHTFFGGIAVFGTPLAAAAVWLISERLRKSQHPILAFGLAAFYGVQLGLGVATATFRLQEFGPRLDNKPVSIALLRAISQLPPDAKLAYACRPFEEISFADSSLLSVDAHTGRRVVPMCFEADVFSTLNGAPPSEQVPTAGFRSAPQWALYPDAAARPSPATITRFLRDHGIGYIFVDAQHPNSLVPDAIPIAASGDGSVLRIP